MSALVTFGCSLTYGQALSDIHPHNQTPSLLAWPQVLGSLLNLPVINMATMGASNKEISHRVLNYNFDADDLVVICWTFTNRFCIIGEKDLCQVGTWKENQKTKAFFKYLHDDNDMYLNQLYCIHYTDLFLKSKKIKNYHLMPYNNKDKRKNLAFFDTNIIDIDYVNLITTNKLALDNSHPSEKTHRILAKKLFKQIQK
tara:strand:- start:3058 stop:3654 length:597 start_codon:yes stop_codon:yes gene_type:complete